MVDKSKKSPVEPKVEETTGEIRRYTDRHTSKANPNFIAGTVEPTTKKKTK